MKRKVVKLGPATLVVSLPTKWIKELNVKQGDEVEVGEQDRDLLIQTKKDSAVEKCEVDISKMDTLMKRYVFAKYIKPGVEESLDKIRHIFTPFLNNQIGTKYNKMPLNK